MVEYTITYCINCGAQSNMDGIGRWFCPPCTEIKEAAYKEARDKDLDNYGEVMALRDKRLREHRDK